MENMKAFVKQSQESNDFILMDIPIPTINDDEVLVKVKAYRGWNSRWIFFSWKYRVSL